MKTKNRGFKILSALISILFLWSGVSWSTPLATPQFYLRPQAAIERAGQDDVYSPRNVRGIMPRALEGQGRTYSSFVDDFLPLSGPLKDGFISLLERLEREAKDTGRKWVWMDAGGQIGLALGQAYDSGRYSHMVPLLIDRIDWRREHYNEDERRTIIEMANRYDVKDPWDKKRLNFVQAELSPDFIIDTPGGAPLCLVTLFAVLGYTPDPLGILFNLYNQLPPGGYLLTQLAIPTDYPHAEELCELYRGLFQDLHNKGVGELKIADWRGKEAVAQRIKPSTEFSLGMILTKDLNNPELARLTLEPQEPVIFTTFTTRGIQYRIVHYRKKTGSAGFFIYAAQQKMGNGVIVVEEKAGNKTATEELEGVRRGEIMSAGFVDAVILGQI